MSNDTNFDFFQNHFLLLFLSCKKQPLRLFAFFTIELKTI